MALRGGQSRFKVWAMLLAGALALPAAAQTPEADGLRVLASVPASADAVVIINNAAAQRSTPAGRRLTQLLDESNSFASSRRAWSNLAATLGTTSEQAFDDLLGRRVMLVLRGVQHPEGPDWAILTDVAPATERRLRERLWAVPRGNLGGLNVLGLEDGSYQLVIARRTSDAPGTAAGGPAGAAYVLLGPGKGGLFEELAPGLLARAQHDPVPGNTADVLAVYRTPRGGSLGGARIMALTASATAQGWNAKLAGSPALVWSGLDPRKLEPWSARAFSRMQQGALAAIVGITEPADEYAPSGARAVLGQLLPFSTLDPQADAGGSRYGIFIRGSGEPLKPRPHSDEPIHAAARYARVVHQADVPSRNTLSVTLALEARDTRRMVVHGDQLIASFLASLRGACNERGSLTMEVAAADQDRRALDLAETLAPGPTLDALEAVFGPEPTLRWGAAVLRDPPRNKSEVPSGWWVATLEPSSGNAAAHAMAALQLPDSADVKRWVSLGVVRPAQLLRAGSPGAAEFLAPLMPLHGVESVQWEAWLREDGMLQGAIQLRMID